MKSVLLPLGVSLLLSLIPVRLLASGEAWNRPQGGYTFRLGIASLSAENEFGPDGGRRSLFGDSTSFSNGDFGMTSINFRGELGITDWLNAVASTEFIIAVRSGHDNRTGRDSTISSSGLGDIWLGGRVRMLSDSSPYAATIALAWKIPSGAPGQSIPLGTGHPDYRISVAAGTAFLALGGIHGFSEIGAAYRLRSGFPNDFSYHGLLNVSLSGPLQLQALLDGVTAGPSTAPATGEPDVSTGALINSQSFSRLSMSAILETSANSELDAGYSGVVAGRRSLASGALTIGISWKN